MAKIKTKINPDLLRTATTQSNVEFDTTRAEILTKIAHKQLDKERIQLDIEELVEEINILDS